MEKHTTSRIILILPLLSITLSYCFNNSHPDMNVKTFSETSLVQNLNDNCNFRVFPLAKVTNLVSINEVSNSSGYYTRPRYIEIYNGTLEEINLANYSIRTSRSLKKSSNSSYQWQKNPHEFTLPRLIISPGSFAIIRSKPKDEKNTDYMVSLIDNNYLPYWDNKGGFIELRKENRVIDIITWGNYDINSKHWIGKLPSMSNLNYHSYARKDYADSNHASDFVEQISTPALPNTRNCQLDKDKDGIPDCAEQKGMGYLGMPLYRWGARKKHRDIFIELDYLDFHSSACVGCNKNAELGFNSKSLEKITKVFKKNNIYIHFDAGNLYDKDNIDGNNVDKYDLCGGSKVAFVNGVNFGAARGATRVNEIKKNNQDSRRSSLFYYILLAYSDKSDGSPASYAGMGYMPGLTSIVWAYQRARRSEAETAKSNWHINYKTSTLFHELGHNLGLNHGGNEGLNYKPNYKSSMNYLYRAVPASAQLEADHYYYLHRDKCKAPRIRSHFQDDPLTFNIDYSHGTNFSLSENSLNEQSGYGQGVAIDFNCNGQIDSANVSFDLNNDGAMTASNDFNDWKAIEVYAASRPNQNAYVSAMSKDNTFQFGWMYLSEESEIIIP